MNSSQILKSVHYWVDDKGHPRAVQLEFPDWKKLLECLEDQEDREVVKVALSKLRKGPAEI